MKGKNKEGHARIAERNYSWDRQRLSGRPFSYLCFGTNQIVPKDILRVEQGHWSGEWTLQDVPMGRSGYLWSLFYLYC
jgi:hypothetical protein